MDKENDDNEVKLVGELARRFLRTMNGHSSFLRFKVSQMAGAALLLAMKVLQSPFATDFGLMQLTNLNARNSFLPDEQYQHTANETEELKSAADQGSS